VSTALDAAPTSPSTPTPPAAAAVRGRLVGVRRAHRWIPAVLVVVPTVAAVHHYGVGWRDLGAFGGYVILCLALPGTLVWRAARRRSGWLAEDVAPGLAIGYAMEVLGYLAARWIGAPLLVLAVPAGVVGAFLAARRLRRYWRTDSDAAGPPTGWLWAMAAIAGLLMFVTCVAYLRTKGVVYSFESTDLPFHLALVGELRHHMPPQVPWVAGVPLRYHWFGYLDLAATSWVTGIEPETLVLRLYHLPLIAGLPVLLGVAAHRLTGRWWPGPIAAVITFFVLAPDPYAWPSAPPQRFVRFGPVDDGSLLRIGLWVSTTQTFAALVCVPLIIVLIDLLRGRDRGWRAWGLLVVLAVVLAGAKATYLPIMLCGLLATLLVNLVVTGTVHRPALLGAGLMLVVTAFAQVLLLRGAVHGMTVNPFDGLRMSGLAQVTGLGREPLSVGGMAVLAALTVLAWAVVWCGTAGLLLRRQAADPAYALMLGVGAGGMAAVLTFSHYSYGQTWFLVAARPYLALAAAGGLAVLMGSGRVTRGQVSGLLASTAAGAALAWLLTAVGPDRPPTVALAGRHAVLIAMSWPYFALVGFILAATAVLWISRAEVNAIRRLAPALMVVGVTACGIPPSIELLADQVRTAAADRFRAVDRHRTAMPAGVRDAARWLREHSDPDDVVATNAHCRSGPPCNNLHFWFTAFAERRFLVEGWGYTAEANDVRDAAAGKPVFAPFWEPAKLADNDAAFRSPTASRIDLLRRAYGVRWLFVDERAGPVAPNLSGFARLRIRVGSCAVYEI
jgi:hypothetical protein